MFEGSRGRVSCVDLPDLDAADRPRLVDEVESGPVLVPEGFPVGVAVVDVGRIVKAVTVPGLLDLVPEGLEVHRLARPGEPDHAPDGPRDVLPAARQCDTLLAAGVAGIHFYTLNRSTATRAIFQHLKGVLVQS